MPDDSGGVYTVPAGTLVNTGDTLLPSQHNPWALDMSTAMSNRFSKDGRAPATGTWNLNTFRITNLGTPVATNDAVNKAYADGLATTFADNGYIFGLTLSNNVGDPVNDIDISIGSASASNTTQPFKMTLATLITKRLDAAWAVGTNQGGLDNGSIANGWYYVWLIQRSDTGVVDALFSISSTAPTMPPSYDRMRRIGSILRASGSIRSFVQTGDNYDWLDVPLDFNVSNPGATTNNRVITAPPNTYANIIVFLQQSDSALTPVYVVYRTDTTTRETQSLTASAQSGRATSVVGYRQIKTNGSSQIGTIVSASNANTIIQNYTTGYIDTRGRLL